MKRANLSEIPAGTTVSGEKSEKRKQRQRRIGAGLTLSTATSSSSLGVFSLLQRLTPPTGARERPGHQRPSPLTSSTNAQKLRTVSPPPVTAQAAADDSTPKMTMEGDQQQFLHLLTSLLSTDNAVRTQAEVGIFRLLVLFGGNSSPSPPVLRNLVACFST